MGIAIESVQLRDVKILSTQSFEDERGFFMVIFSEDQFAAVGLPTRLPMTCVAKLQGDCVLTEL